MPLLRFFVPVFLKKNDGGGIKKYSNSGLSGDYVGNFLKKVPYDPQKL